MSTKTDELMRQVVDLISRRGDRSHIMRIEALRTAIQEVVKDAERYRTLRRSLSGEAGCSHTEMPCVVAPRTDWLQSYTPDGLDKAIDAAMQPEAMKS